MTVLELLFGQVCMHALVRSTRCLLEAVERVLQFTHQLLLPQSHKSLQLLHVDVLLKHAVEECCFDVQLLQLEALNHNHDQQHPQRRHICNGNKRLGVVHTLHL